MENSLQLVMVQITYDFDLYNKKKMGVRFIRNIMHTEINRKVASVSYQQIKWK